VVPFLSDSAVPKTYRFAVHVSGRALPSVDKSLRLLCTLNAADHTVVGVSAVIVPLGTAADCDHRLELVHDPGDDDAARRPRYFELVASLSPVSALATRLRGVFAAHGPSDGTEYRIAGMMDPARCLVELPEIALRGA
jgi:hypothetical protein